MRIGRQQIANALAIVADVLPKISGLMLSQWVHAVIDVVGFSQMSCINGVVPDGTGSITIYTVPKGCIFQLLNVDAVATTGTWTVTDVRVYIKSSAGWSNMRKQTAGSSIVLGISSVGVNCYALHEGDLVALSVAVDTAGVAGFSVLGRLMKG